MKNFKAKNSAKSRETSNRETGAKHWEKAKGSRSKPANRNLSSDGSIWLWGTHAVDAAVLNPNRDILEIIATKNAASHLPQSLNAKNIKIKVVEPEFLSEFLPPNSVHQGIAARVKPLPAPDYDKVLEGAKFVFVLDQLTDPQNIGSIFRTAAAFGAAAIIQQDRKAPPITGSLAKAAQGGIEIIPDLRVVNISQTIIELSEQGFCCIGLDMTENSPSIAKALDGEKRPIAIILGAEGKGLRQLVSERCDCIAHIPMPGKMESLNVSNAAAIAAYEVCRK
jgi:23S rRNA (guanosine2251-2'-O)-methyltransferase